jgi:hypothetical protein
MYSISSSQLSFVAMLERLLANTILQKKHHSHAAGGIIVNSA